MPNWKKVVVSGSAANLSSLHVDNSITASIFSGSSFIGNLTGTASYAATASHVNPLVQNVFVTGALNITGSNTLVGTKTITGSVFITGSKTVVGTNTITGSFNVSGSTTQVGNNTLLGNTTLSGSIIISGSQGQPNPTISVFGDLNQTGYTRYLPVTNNIDSSLSASYIYVSGSTQDLYFAQNSKGYTNTTRLRWLEGNMYTGLLNGGVLTTASSTVYQVSSGSGIIVNLNASLNDNPYPTIQYLNWGNLTQSIAPLSASYDQQYVAIQPNGTIFAQGTPFIDGQFDALINIGIVLHQNHSTINLVKTQPQTAYGLQQGQNIFNRAFGSLKLSGFTVAVSGSSTGSIILGSGTSYAPGANYVLDPNSPSYITDPGTNVSKIWRYYDSGSNWVYDTNNGAGYPNLDPSRYSNNGTLTLVGNNNYSIQRVFWFPNSVSKAFVVYYGNAVYSTLSDAIANLNIERFVEAPNTAANAIYLGAFAIKGGTNTTLQNSNEYTWIPGGLFRNVGGNGGGGSTITTTLTGLTDVNIAGPTDLQPFAYSTMQAKWINTSILSASIVGNATTATTASYALTASYVINAVSASHAETASYSLESLSASLAQLAISSSYAVTASYALNGGSGGGGGATTGSNTFFGDQIISGSLTVTGSITSNVLLTPTTASNVAVPTGFNGMLISPVQLAGTSSVAIGSNLIIL